MSSLISKQPTVDDIINDTRLIVGSEDEKYIFQGLLQKIKKSYPDSTNSEIIELAKSTYDFMKESAKNATKPRDYIYAYDLEELKTYTRSVILKKNKKINTDLVTIVSLELDSSFILTQHIIDSVANMVNLEKLIVYCKTTHLELLSLFKNLTPKLNVLNLPNILIDNEIMTELETLFGRLINLKELGMNGCKFESGDVKYRFFNLLIQLHLLENINFNGASLNEDDVVNKFLLHLNEKSNIKEVWISFIEISNQELAKILEWLKSTNRFIYIRYSNKQNDDEQKELSSKIHTELIKKCDEFNIPTASKYRHWLGYG